MNILGLVFSLLLILSYGFYACWDKHVASSQLRNTYVGHERAHRKLLNKYQSALYAGLRTQRIDHPDDKEQKSEKPTSTKTEQPDANWECAKINLQPLILDGKVKHPFLYELTAKLIRTFYSPLCKEKRFEHHLLDELIAKAKEDSSIPLEKLKLGKWQRLYYKMLKGSKEWDLAKGTGHPSLLDYVKLEPNEQKVCLFHAHPDLMTVLFNGSIAAKLYTEVHKQDGPVLTQELVERICSEEHLIGIDSALFALLEFGKPYHQEQKKMFLAKDNSSQVTLRKQIYLKR